MPGLILGGLLHFGVKLPGETLIESEKAPRERNLFLFRLTGSGWFFHSGFFASYFQKSPGRIISMF